MIFPSYVFLLAFLPLVLAFWLSRLPLRTRLFGLTVASYFFYGWWDYRFTSLMAASTLIDYYCGFNIHRNKHNAREKKRYLLASIVSNLLMLGIFKYCDFFIGSADAVMHALGLQSHLTLLNIILPIGISFYTFQSMSYSLDIYRGASEPAPDFLHFAAYVSLFPQLVAGPIIRYQEMADQLKNLKSKRLSYTELSYGTWLFFIGMSKKLFIADQMALAADALFNVTGPASPGPAWYGSLSYTLQLYFDFSGYSDMAMGLGLMLGFRFPINFNSPYKSRNLSEFWDRWHISLSRFLRDYLFIPLGGSHEGNRMTLRNLFITMALGGLWHGAQWTFVVWGLYHGLLMVIHGVSKMMRFPVWPHPAGVLGTFLAVHFGWVLFRAPTFGNDKAKVTRRDHAKVTHPG